MAVYLVTGIAGFIGSSLARALLEQGERVRGIDNFSHGNPANIAEIRSRIEFIEADINDASACAQACRGVDFVLHQAALGSVPRSLADPLATNRANVAGTLSVLLAARDAGVRRFLYASSSSVYGDSPELPKRESMAVNPISPYAVSKLAGEQYTRSFWRMYGLPTVALRYFNVFGPRQNAVSPYAAAMAKFIPMMLCGERPTIFGDGEQSRDFTFVENVVAANLCACRADEDQVAGRTFNIAAGRRVSLNQVYTILQKLTGYERPAQYAAERVGDVRHTLADIALARAHLGYAPSVMVEEGLERTVAWYRAQMAHAASAR